MVLRGTKEKVTQVSSICDEVSHVISEEVTPVGGTSGEVTIVTVFVTR